MPGQGPRAHVDSHGNAKVAYSTQDHALARARVLARQQGWPVDVYPCGTCPAWHLGRPAELAPEPYGRIVRANP